MTRDPARDRARNSAGDRARVDLAADAGESFGRWSVVDEAALFESLSSVHLACGFHAGDPAGLRRSIERALAAGLATGAHPGYPDVVGFGRRHMGLSTDELFADTAYQIGALRALLKVQGTSLHHVKAHGALYHDIHANERLADAFARAVVSLDASVPIVLLAGPAGEMARDAAEAVGARVVTEAFPDRAYLRSGNLAPRSMDGSVITDPEDVAWRAVALATGVSLPALDGGDVAVTADTLCVHGDGDGAVAIAARVRSALESEGVTVRPF